MPRPSVVPPIGLRLTRTAHAVSQAFERAMAQAGGSASTWQVLLLVRAGEARTQAGLARAIGVTGATLTHHLNALEKQGLVRRWREPGDRRTQRAELTAEGEEAFRRLRAVARRHDARLRAALTDDEVAALAGLLDRLQAAVGPRDA